MANIKSAKKRIKVIAKKTLRNKMVKSRTKTAIKKVIVAINGGNKDDAKALLGAAMSSIDKAAQKGVYHKNAAARKKSTISKLVDKM